ncbi:hypothetical protein BH23PLA1_BH23PLA1_15170 [soil metagenome]
MKPLSSWVAPLAAVGLGLTLAGCGGSSSDGEPVVNLSDPAYQGPQLARQAPASAAAPEPVAEQEAPAPEASRRSLTMQEPEAPGMAGESEPETSPTPVATRNESSPRRNDDAFAMNEMLSAGASGPQEVAAAGAGSGAAGPGGQGGASAYEGGGSGMEGYGEDYPGMGGDASAAYMGDGGEEDFGADYPGFESGYPGMDGDDGFGGGYGGAGLGGGGAGGAEKAGDFSSPARAVDSFLNAARSRNLQRLAEATALRAPLEAEPQNRDLFQAILESSLAPDELERIASLFDGYKISGSNQMKSTGSMGIIVSKPAEGSNATLSRTIQVRKEKAGWKVKDISGERRLDRMQGMGRARR